MLQCGKAGGVHVDLHQPRHTLTFLQEKHKKDSKGQEDPGVFRGECCRERQGRGRERGPHRLGATGDRERYGDRGEELQMPSGTSRDYCRKDWGDAEQGTEIRLNISSATHRTVSLLF